MSPDEIKVDHCYSMTPIKGRRTIARVTELFRITAMAAYGGTETLELNPIVVRFVWRHAAYPTGWSNRRQQLLLDDFVLAAEKVIGDDPDISSDKSEEAMADIRDDRS
jgi:hypothetical protein